MGMMMIFPCCRKMAYYLAYYRGLTTTLISQKDPIYKYIWMMMMITTIKRHNRGVF